MKLVIYHLENRRTKNFPNIPQVCWGRVRTDRSKPSCVGEYSYRIQVKSGYSSGIESEGGDGGVTEGCTNTSWLFSWAPLVGMGVILLANVRLSA